MNWELRGEKNVIRFLLLLSITCLALSLSRCSAPVVAPEPQPSPTTSLPAPQGLSIAAIVDGSSCRSVFWPKRGKMPRSTLIGFAETFQKSYCAKRQTLTKPATQSSQDGFYVYQDVPVSLPNLYALLLSSAMMESSGEVCTGRDTSAGEETSNQAESGILQQSYNIEDMNPELVSIVNEYKSHLDRCGFSTFRQFACPTSGIVGSGPGADFQRLMIKCPALAIEQSAIGFRVAVRHWGPARRGDLIFRKDCADMFTQVQSVTRCQ